VNWETAVLRDSSTPAREGRAERAGAGRRLTYQEAVPAATIARQVRVTLVPLDEEERIMTDRLVDAI
jgi:hypothetical protein